MSQDARRALSPYFGAGGGACAGAGTEAGAAAGAGVPGAPLGAEPAAAAGAVAVPAGLEAGAAAGADPDTGAGLLPASSRIDLGCSLACVPMYASARLFTMKIAAHTAVWAVVRSSASWRRARWAVSTMARA